MKENTVSTTETEIQPETTEEAVVEPEETPEPDDGEVDEDGDVFPRDYVEKLRKAAGDARVKAKDRDDLAHRLHASLVAATGRLADPSDLAFDESHIADPDALTAAVEDLLAHKPHLASRRPRGDVGQGVTGSTTPTNLAGILRSRA
mgnify:CR=1 FL=1